MEDNQSDSSDSDDNAMPFRLLLPNLVVDSEGRIVDNLIEVHFENIFDDLKCPICLGVLDKTWAVMACLHRFCSECLHKTLRADLGPNRHHECPACRKKLASRRASNPDPSFDFLVALFGESNNQELPLSDESSAQRRIGFGYDTEMSADDILKFKRMHEDNIMKFRVRQSIMKEERELKRMKIDALSSSTSSQRLMLNDIDLNFLESKKMETLVAFRLTPWPEDLEDHCKQFPLANLLRPYLTSNADIKIRDLKQLLFESKAQLIIRDSKLSIDNVNNIGIGIPFQNKIFDLSDDLTMYNVCVNYWSKNGPLDLHYRYYYRQFVRLCANQ